MCVCSLNLYYFWHRFEILYSHTGIHPLFLYFFHDFHRRESLCRKMVPTKSSPRVSSRQCWIRINDVSSRGVSEKDSRVSLRNSDGIPVHGVTLLGNKVRLNKQKLTHGIHPNIGANADIELGEGLASGRHYKNMISKSGGLWVTPSIPNSNYTTTSPS